MRLSAVICVLAACVHAPPEGAAMRGGACVVLVHGLGGNRDVWSEADAALAQTHTVVRVDLPGSGGTAGPALERGAADLEAVAAGVVAQARRAAHTPCLLVGHSMGGPVAALAVLQDPAAFKGLLLVDSFLAPLPEKEVEALVQQLELEREPALREFYGSMAASPAQTERLVREAQRLPGEVFTAYLRALARDFMKGRHAGLRLPVLQLQAGPPVGPEEFAQYGFTGVPNLRVVAFPNAKHWVMWDEPEAFVRELVAFEQSLDAGR